MVPVLIQVLQSLVVLTLAPLYAGVLARAEAVVGSKRGPSVLQPYRDLAKLLRKGSAVSDQASWVFRGAPFVAFACYLTVSVIVPVITNDAAAAGVPRRPDRRRVRAHAGQLRDLAGRAGHRQPVRRARREPGQLDRQHGRARADPGVLHRRRGVRVRQPVPDEPRDRVLAVRAGAADPPARPGRLLHDRAGGERPDPDRQPGRVDRDLDDRGKPGARVLGPGVRAGQVGQLDEAVPAVVGLHERVRAPVGAGQRRPTCPARCWRSRSCSASWRCAGWRSWSSTPRSPSCGSSGSPSSSAPRSCWPWSASPPPT